MLDSVNEEKATKRPKMSRHTANAAASVHSENGPRDGHGEQLRVDELADTKEGGTERHRKTGQAVEKITPIRDGEMTEKIPVRA